MNKEQLLNDLDFAASLAKDGANTPLLGGRIGLMWGILLSITFIAQWAILSGTLPIDPKNLLFLWIGFALVGSGGSLILNRQIADVDGARSTINRVEKYVWMMFAMMINTIFVGLILNIAFFDGTPIVFGFMVAAGFAGQGLAYGLVAIIADIKWLKLVSLMSFIMAATCFALYNTILVYLIGGIASLITIVVPSLYCMKAEQTNG
ncbi:hypothetical protein [Kordiimonas sp. SCSIO 12610]|uniref:hypothetical protein n=1 Tax=Kordiimonas sp. SCSIO 12610 TaxID=2829597 RepID=UPI00210A3D88|nr:hypothetical protein [Kordiimonas sp. SCSIO 12610]UTW56238.1 hypothetical protein KFF44_04885 [Kordiimonas sp. SCSIO 12610]